MFLILLCLYQLSHASGARVRRLQISDVLRHSGPVHADCGTSEREQLLAAKVQHEQGRCLNGGCKNAFSICSYNSRYVSAESLSTEPLKLCELGKLAKNGNFFASEDGAVLVKRIDRKEAEVLAEWGELAFSWLLKQKAPEYPGGCSAFSDTRLIHMLVSFALDHKPFVVMPNITHYLQRVSPSNWRVQSAYDAKPLPNLGEGLVKLFQDLQNTWGKGLAKINEWQGWQEVRTQLEIDLAFLEGRVVDFSLFVHVLKSQGDNNGIPRQLHSSNGCIVDTSRTTILCFHIIDYLTPLTWKRVIESKYKASKFDDYGSKFLLAFDCIGDVSQESCANYNALASITEAMSVSKAMGKSVFVGAKAFPTAYTCTESEPLLEYRKIRNAVGGKSLGDLVSVDEIMRGDVLQDGVLGKEVVWHTIAESSKDVAQWLQSVASPEAATNYIGNLCSDNVTDSDCISAIVEHTYLSGKPLDRELETQADFWTRMNMHSCTTLVNEFATEGYTTKGNHSADMHSVLWAPSQKSVIVVRGLPKVPTYQHQNALVRARYMDCFLRMRYLRCTPEESAGVYFNYQQHFGTLEVMILSPREQYVNAEIQAQLTQKGIRTFTSLDLAFDRF